MGNNVSPMIGGKGGSEFSFQCPAGTYITGISGVSGSKINALQFTCSNGKKSPWFGKSMNFVSMGVSGSGSLVNGIGGNKPVGLGIPAGTIKWGVVYGHGFEGIKARSGAVVDMLTFKKSNGSYTRSFGGNGGSPIKWDCPKGHKITGVKGRAGDLIDAIQFTSQPRKSKYNMGSNGGSTDPVMSVGIGKKLDIVAPTDETPDIVDMPLTPLPPAPPSEEWVETPDEVITNPEIILPVTEWEQSPAVDIPEQNNTMLFVMLFIFIVFIALLSGGAFWFMSRKTAIGRGEYANY